jgi:hypothetical protein
VITAELWEFEERPHRSNLRHQADRQILIWTDVTFIRPLRDWTPRLLKLVLLSTRARGWGGLFHS